MAIPGKAAGCPNERTRPGRTIAQVACAASSVASSDQARAQAESTGSAANSEGQGGSRAPQRRSAANAGKASSGRAAPTQPRPSSSEHLGMRRREECHSDTAYLHIARDYVP